MVKSRTHPRIERRIETNLANKRKKLTAKRANCIAALERGIASLKLLSCPPDCDKARSLIGIFEWALVELSETDVGSPPDAERIAGVGRLLQRLS